MYRQTETQRSRLDETSVRFLEFCKHAGNEWLWVSLLIPGRSRYFSLHHHVYTGCKFHIAAFKQIPRPVLVINLLESEANY
jgi:hypothetical protein